MDQNRKDILKRGVNVTLYPLPFRKGGKIKNGATPQTGASQTFGQGGQYMNNRLGDKTIKPGVEYNNGGAMGINSLRTAFTDPRKKQQVQSTQQQTSTLLSQAGQDENKQAFLLKYHEAMAAGDKGTADAMLMAMGGIQPPPAAPARTSTPSNLPPTDWKNLGFSGTNRAGGYRYNAGQGKPAAGSITNSGLGMRRSKFGR